jgi:hypothetical protein
MYINTITKTITDMSRNELLLEQYYTQLETATENLAKWQAKGWEVQVKASKELIQKIEKKIDDLEEKM